MRAQELYLQLKTLETEFLQAMETMTPDDIEAAFANSGYLEMLPESCQYVGRNDSGKWMYDCEWEATDPWNHILSCPEPTYHARAFIWVEGDRILGDC